LVASERVKMVGIFEIEVFGYFDNPVTWVVGWAELSHNKSVFFLFWVTIFGFGLILELSLVV